MGPTTVEKQPGSTQQYFENLKSTIRPNQITLFLYQDTHYSTKANALINRYHMEIKMKFIECGTHTINYTIGITRVWTPYDG